MKLIIQIACFNEADTLPRTLADLPRQVPGFTSVEYLVIDDGSSDGTAAVARSNGVDYVVSLPGHQGLARAFLAGVLAGLERGADVIVNTDGDNQYNARSLPDLVAPIVAGQADMVIGARPIWSIKHFSFLKRILQRLGSRVVRALTGVHVLDAPCGFRALTRETALRLQVFSSFSYSLETIVQASAAGLRVVSVPIAVNAPTRESRLFRGNLTYVVRSLWTLLFVYTIYRPLRVFGVLGGLCLVPGIALAGRYAWLMAEGEGRGHVQSVIASGVLLLAALFFFIQAILAHLLQVNRRVLEETCYRAREERFRPRQVPRREEGAEYGKDTGQAGRDGRGPAVCHS